jgi:multiple sugar transport system permease protein
MSTRSTSPDAGEHRTGVRGRLGALWIRALDRPATWLAPAVVLLTAFQLYPLVAAAGMSLTDASLLRQETALVGLAQYRRLLGSAAFWASVRTTTVYAVASVSLQVGLGVVVALAIDHGVRRALYGHLATRVAVLLAWVVPGVIVGLVWKVLFIESEFGALNALLAPLGVGPVSWLSEPTLALASTVVAGTWRGTAFAMILVYAGLQRIPQELYDAARVDGAGRWARFRYVTVPQLKPVVFVTTVLVSIYALNTFDLVYALTGGGPGRATEVLALFMYQEGFAEYHLGRAAAVAVLLLALNLVVTGAYLRAFDVTEDL